MAARKKPPGRQKGKSKSLKLTLWLKHFLNSSNPATFLNKSASSRAAGYNAKSDECFGTIGNQNFKRHRSKIQAWMDDEGLGENELKAKLIEGLNCTETIFKGHKVEGAAYIMHHGVAYRMDEALNSEDMELCECAKHVLGLGARQGVVDTGYIIEQREVIPWDVRRKYLELAMDVKKMIGAKRLELTGADGGPIRHQVDPWGEILAAVGEKVADGSIPRRGDREVRGQVVAAEQPVLDSGSGRTEG